jgi:glucose-6-phosphate 1-dehydrogenase
MLVTHLFQVLGITAMERPNSFDADSLRDQKVKVFESMRRLEPTTVVRAQYDGYIAAQGWRPTPMPKPSSRLRCS